MYTLLVYVAKLSEDVSQRAVVESDWEECDKENYFDLWSLKWQEDGKLKYVIKEIHKKAIFARSVAVPNSISCILITRRTVSSCVLFLLGLGNIRLSPQGIRPCGKVMRCFREHSNMFDEVSCYRSERVLFSRQCAQLSRNDHLFRATVARL